MKLTLVLVVAALAMFVVAPTVFAADHAKGDKAKGAYGEVTKIDTDGKEITIKGKDDAETKIKYTDATKVQIAQKPAEGEKPTPKEAKIDDVKVGTKIGVKLADDGTAATITILPAGAGKKAEKKTE
jgi:Rieske Fe-S protein